ncbi:MAG: FAD:protein FMN transferase [Actinomycetota bacterium]|nr:FAD:protein FMN transferase [Actinomycetota bacterium]
MNARTGLCHVEEVMGTRVTIDVRDRALPGGHQAAVIDAVRWLHWVDRTFSLYRADSVLSRLARREIGVSDCPAAVGDVLALAATCRELTGGAFDPRWPNDGTVDPTGLVKGWAAQAAGAILTTHGSLHHTVNAAGDLWVQGQARPGQDWAVGIAHPLRPGHLVAVIKGHSLAVATSGGSERGAHVIDPRTGKPATALASVTVTGPDLARADAFATAGVALGDDAVGLLESLDQDGWASLVVFADGQLWSSAHFEGRVVADGLAPQSARA